MSRVHNFSAGPALLPEVVVQEIIETLPDFKSTGQGLMEISHRSPEFDETLVDAESRLRRIMSIPDDYSVLFQQGGASLQFYASALNLLPKPNDQADFILTGTWSNKALKEAQRVGDAQGVWDGKDEAYRRIPKNNELALRGDASYVHYTTNNTIYGTQFHQIPAGEHLVSDMSSDICSRAIDVSAHDIIYAGAQKNLGPSGIAVVILSPWVLERSPPGLPSMLDYKLQADKRSLFNTTNTFAIFALERVLAWIEELGGLDAMETRNADKAQLLYDEIDRTDFWTPIAEPASRSLMNVTWRLPNEALDKAFVAEATEAGLKALKGHRSVGGIRASIYNACEPSSVKALVSFMREFERRHG